MTQEEFAELPGTARRLADAGDAIVKALALHTREIKDPAQHATFSRLLQTVRDCSASLNFALRDAPAPRKE